MIKTSISLQDLRRRIYLKAKADKAMAVLGIVCSCLQDGDASGGLRDGQEE